MFFNPPLKEPSMAPYLGKTCTWKEMEVEFRFAFWYAVGIAPTAILLAKLFPHAFG